MILLLLSLATTQLINSAHLVAFHSILTTVTPRALIEQIAAFYITFTTVLVKQKRYQSIYFTAFSTE